MIVFFLEGSFPDYCDRYLSNIWKYSDKQIEEVHDYIQWIFPLDTLSKAVPHSPALINEEIIEIRSSELAQENLLKSKEWFLDFLSRSDRWVAKKNHNHKRISRMIRSLRLLHSDDAADECAREIIKLASQKGMQSRNVIEFWKKC